MKIRIYNLILVVLISSCTSQSITISSSVPSPLVLKDQNVSVITIYGDTVKNYLFQSTALEETDSTWDINFQDTQKKVFAIIFGSFFSNILERDSFDSLDTTDTDLVLSVNLEKFEYLTPQLASNDKFSIWIKYTIKIYNSDLELVQNWDITGYGEQETGSFDGNQAMANAINLALRDVGANLTIQIEKELNELMDLVK
jgi:hypothetical protein